MSDSPKDPPQSAKRHIAYLLAILKAETSNNSHLQVEDHSAIAALSHPPGQRSDGDQPRRLLLPATNNSRTQGKSNACKRKMASHCSQNRWLNIGEYLSRPDGRIARLMGQIGRLAQTNRLLRLSLPPPLNDHATLTKLDRHEWVVQTDSPAWAYRLRYDLPNLRRQLQKRLATVIPPLRIRIAPAATPIPSTPHRRMILTEETADLLESTARRLTDRRLRAALMRLARHGRHRAKR